MEQDERLYEYKMGSEVFRFEARTHQEAEEIRGMAIQYFAERSGPLFSEAAIIGPDLAEMPKGFRVQSTQTRRATGSPRRELPR